MATLNHLLRLPPSLRCHLLANNTSLLHRSRPSERLYGDVLSNLRRSYAQAAKQSKVPKPRLRGAQPPTPRAPPAPAAPFHSTNYANTILRDADAVLLYNSPSHTSFAWASYTAGAAFLVAALNWAWFAKESANPDSPVGRRELSSWWLRGTVSTLAIMFAAIGTRFMLAPTKLIRRVYLMKNTSVVTSSESHMLRIETKPVIPLLPTKYGRTIDAPLRGVSLTGTVRLDEEHFRSVPLAMAQDFTQYYLHGVVPPTAGNRPNIFRRANTALLNIWPAARQDIRRMFVRDSIAKLIINGENGSWKLDLYNAEFLEGGMPMSKLIKKDPDTTMLGLIKWLQSWLA